MREQSVVIVYYQYGEHYAETAHKLHSIFTHKNVPIIIVEKLVKKFKKAGLVIDIRFPGLSLY